MKFNEGDVGEVEVFESDGCLKRADYKEDHLIKEYTPPRHDVEVLGDLINVIDSYEDAILDSHADNLVKDTIRDHIHVVIKEAEDLLNRMKKRMEK